MSRTAVVKRQNYELEATALRIQGELSFDDWSGIGVWLEQADKAIQWWIGDWMNYGEERFGEQFAQAIEATGWAIATIRQYAWVCAKVPPKNRRPDLTFFHHREVADLPVDDQAAWLDKAIAGDNDGADPWSSDRLRREIKSKAKGGAVKIWVMVAATDQEDAESLCTKFKAEGREAKIR